jgi:hemerythrin superfamily protein
MNVITLLKNDHRTVEALFAQFEKAKDGRMKKRLVNEMIKELSKHAAVEEQIVYPAARKVLDEEDPVLEALEEHHVVKWTLSEIEKMSPDAERFDAKVKVLIDMVRHHVEEEEGELFPKLREKLDMKQLNAIGMAVENAKKAAPSRPHPRQPDTPPGNVVMGLGAGILDKMRDGARSMRTSMVNRMAKARDGAKKTSRSKSKNGRKSAQASR